MQTYNAQATKRLVFWPVPEYLCGTYGGMVKTLALQLIADQRQIMKEENDSRIDSFIQGTKRLLELGATEVSISENLRVAREAEKFAVESNARLLQIEEENMAEFDRRLKEFEKSMIKKMERSPYKYFIKRTR
jgi:ABC-type uncharacterized transport system ATPase component